MDYYYLTNTEETNYSIVKLWEHLEALDTVKYYKGISVDTETTGLDPHTKKLRLIQIACKGFPTLVIDCYKVDNLSAVKNLLENTEIKKIFQNAKFDIQFLKTRGIQVKGKLYDTMVAGQLIDSGQKKSNSLGNLAERYLNIKIDKSEQKSDWSWIELSKEQLDYAAKDVELLLPLRNAQIMYLKDLDLIEIAEIEFSCIYAVAEMEFNGIKIDWQQWNSIKEEYRQKKSELEKYLIEEIKSTDGSDMFGKVAVNLDSPVQMKKYVKSLGFDVSGVNFEELAPLRDNLFIDNFLKYKKYTHSLKSFLEVMQEKANYKTGRIHSSYWQMGSAAGRFSCSDPNLQQVPSAKEFRSCFVPEEGNSFVIADYSQIELRVAAEVAKDRRMIEAYQTGEDLHRLTASLVSRKPMEEITKEERQMAKAVNFGLIYGMGADTLVTYAKNNYGVAMTSKEAREFKKLYFESYSGIHKWHEQTKKDRPTETRTMLNRRRIFSKDPDAFTLTDKLNSPVQGTAADFLKKALGELAEKLPIGVKLIGTIHDEVILEAPTEKAPEIAELLQKTMEGVNILSFPIVAEAKVCSSWGEK